VKIALAQINPTVEISPETSKKLLPQVAAQLKQEHGSRSFPNSPSAAIRRRIFLRNQAFLSAADRPSMSWLR